MNFRRWADDDGEESDDDHPTSYLDVVRRPVKPVTTSPPRAQPRSIIVRDHGEADAGQ